MSTRYTMKCWVFFLVGTVASQGLGQTTHVPEGASLAPKTTPGPAEPPPEQNTILADVMKEQSEEMPLLDLSKYDPAQMAVCDDILSPEDIYTSMVDVMIRVENALRNFALKNNQSNLQKVFGLHSQALPIKSLYGRKLARRSAEDQKKHPIVAKYIDTMAQASENVIAFAEGGFYDHRLMMKLVRISMKMFANKLACKEIAFDIAKNRFGWPSKFGASPAAPNPAAESAGFSMGSVAGVAPSTKDPNDPGSVPFTRWSGTFMDPKPAKWPWNGWPWMANNNPPEMTDAGRGTQGDQANYNVPNANNAKS